MTKQRRVILETIQESREHMTSEEIFIKAKEKLTNLALATAYNNLKSLVQDGKIRRIQIPGQPDRYDRNMVWHEHLVCECCGTIVDAEAGDFISQVEENLGIHITNYSLTLYYRCPACADSEQ